MVDGPSRVVACLANHHPGKPDSAMRCLDGRPGGRADELGMWVRVWLWFAVTGSDSTLVRQRVPPTIQRRQTAFNAHIHALHADADQVGGAPARVPASFARQGLTDGEDGNEPSRRVRSTRWQTASGQ